MKKIVLSMSGGLDSATLLFSARSLGHEVVPVFFNYGAKHNLYERHAAHFILGSLKLPLHQIDLTGIMRDFKSDLLQSGGEIPEGHYEAESMKRTVVPGRNMIFASILAGVAWSADSDTVWLGIHQGDHAIYPDCRPAFAIAMKRAIETGTDEKVSMEAPFLTYTKAEIVKMGLKLGVPSRWTRTCYKAQEIACGKCGSCQERLVAFVENGVEDPIQYFSREIIPRENIQKGNWSA